MLFVRQLYAPRCAVRVNGNGVDRVAIMPSLRVILVAAHHLGLQKHMLHVFWQWHGNGITRSVVQLSFLRFNLPQVE